MYEVVEKQPNMLKASGRTYVSSNSDLPGYASFSEELLTQGVGRDDAIVEGLQGYRKAFGELKEMLPKWVRVFRGEGKAHQFEAANAALVHAANIAGALHQMRETALDQHSRRLDPGDVGPDPVADLGT